MCACVQKTSLRVMCLMMIHLSFLAKWWLVVVKWVVVESKLCSLAWLAARLLASRVEKAVDGGVYVAEGSDQSWNENWKLVTKNSLKVKLKLKNGFFGGNSHRKMTTIENNDCSMELDTQFLAYLGCLPVCPQSPWKPAAPTAPRTSPRVDC